ncbi:NXPE family member 3-like [Ptychodera flava]|uniref:NXPE family member 3-like n=1 Tax=Ptychodera flava TaxID=63121 RepID=UPI00396A18A2
MTSHRVVSNRQKLIYPIFLFISGFVVGVLMLNMETLLGRTYQKSRQRKLDSVVYDPSTSETTSYIAKATPRNYEDVDSKHGLCIKDWHGLFFPYNRYNRFAMEWVGIIDELEWAIENRKTESDVDSFANDDSSILIGTGSLGMTSPERTRVILQRRTYYVGDTIHVTLETFDGNGRRRMRGGDFFEAVMMTTQPFRGTTGKVVDYLNGTYSIYFYAGWSGDATIRIGLSFTRETINFLNTVVRPQEQRVLWNVDFRKDGEIYNTTCGLKNEGIWSNVCEYSIEAAIGKTVYLCDKHENIGCAGIETVRTTIRLLDEMAERFNLVANNSAFFESRGGQVGDPIGVLIKEPDVINRRLNLPECGPDLPIPLLDGYWLGKTSYRSLVCRARHWSPGSFKRCLSGRTITLFGDSTLGQIHDIIKRRFGYAEVDHYFPAFKIGPNPASFWEQSFAVNVINGIRDERCNSTIFIMNLSFHFSSWTTRAYLERLLHIKHTLKQLLIRCPGIPILIKGSHPRENDYTEQSIHSSNWIFFDMNRMMRRVMGGLGIMFIDVWDMCASYYSKTLVHMPDDVIEQEVHLMTSYICPSTTLSEHEMK